jgi:hypothetical protein
MNLKAWRLSWRRDNVRAHAVFQGNILQYRGHGLTASPEKKSLISDVRVLSPGGGDGCDIGVKPARGWQFRSADAGEAGRSGHVLVVIVGAFTMYWGRDTIKKKATRRSRSKQSRRVAAGAGSVCETGSPCGGIGEPAKTRGEGGFE